MIITEAGKKFKEIEEEIYKYVCGEGVKLLETIISQIDLKISYNRDRKKYRDKGLRKSVIKTVMGEVEYSRRVYEVKEKGKKEYHYLADELLGLKNGVGSISENLCEKIVKAVCEEPYRKVAERLSGLGNQSLSHQGVWNVVQVLGKRVSAEEKSASLRAKRNEGRGEAETKVLFEEHDGIYLRLQGKSRKKRGSQAEMKVGIAYSGWKKTGKDRYNTTHKVAYAGFDAASVFYAGKEGAISDYYNVDEIEMRILNGDGASWIKSGVNDENTYYQLDPYHRNRAIERYVNDEERRGELRELLYNNDAEKLLKTIKNYADESAVDEERQQEHEGYTKLLSYYSNNKDGLIPYNQRDMTLPPPTGDTVYRNLGTMESNIFSLIGFRMKGRRANWSICGGNHLAKLLTLKNTGRLTQMLGKITEPQCPQPTSPPLSAAKVPTKVGKGWNAFIQASIPYTIHWLKDLCKIRFPVDSF
jgi:hypothetical protein